MVQDRVTQSVPSILLLDKHHHAWAEKALTDGQHVSMTMPIRMKEFRDVIQRLVGAKSVSRPATQS